MNRASAQALVLVNWKGIFYERFLIDRHVTALEGANGAGKTTVMIAAYIVLLPDMSRLRFTNLGETGATGGDKGIWGRLGETGRPAYSVIDFTLSHRHRLIAGVHLERKGEPSVLPTPFIISGLDSDVRLQDVLLLSQGDHEVVPELNELRENVASVGGRVLVFNTAREYFATLFDYGVTPLRLGTDEERNKLNELLRTSMTGGISRALTSELRSFLLKEESGLADTLRRMKANLDSCRRTRTEVQEARKLEQEIGGVFDAGEAMFAAAYQATWERANELQRRLDAAEETQREAKQRLAEAEEQLVRVCDELSKKEVRQEILTKEGNAAENWFKRILEAHKAAKEIERRREELSIAQNDAQIAKEKRVEQENILLQRREAVRRCRQDHRRALAGFTDLQSGLDELHHRAASYRKVSQRKAEAEKLLGVDALGIGVIADLIAESKTRLNQVDHLRRNVKQRLADAEYHSQEHAKVLAALEMMADSTIEPSCAHQVALQQFNRIRDLQALAERQNDLFDELTKVRELASQQAAARKEAEKFGFSFSGQQPARIEITEHLERLQKEYEQLLEQLRKALAGITDCEHALDTARAQQKKLIDRQPMWHDLETRARYLAKEVDLPLASLHDLQTARKLVAQRLAQAKEKQSGLIKNREDLQSEARELLAAGGPFDPGLLQLNDDLGSELLAKSFENVSLEDAAVLEAKLGPLVQALVVEDPVVAANQVCDRAESIPEVWLISRDGDSTQLCAGTVPQRPEANDIVVPEQNATRVTRIPSRPRLGRKAREKRAAELRADATELDAQIEKSMAESRRLERLAENGEVLLMDQDVWLGGDPALKLAEISSQLEEAEGQKEIHSADAARYRNTARKLEPRIKALRGLLGIAVFLDPPDHTRRRDFLQQQYDSALAAQAEIQRCGNATRTVENGFDVLRRLPLKQEEIAGLDMKLKRLSDESTLLDTAIEAMEFVTSNAKALDWDDAPVQLETKQSLVPALQEQLFRAENTLNKADEAVEAAEDDFTNANTGWQEADGLRLAAIKQLQADERRFTEINIPDPTDSAVEAARVEMHRVKEMEKELSTELDKLKTTKGRRESELEFAGRDCKLADEKVEAERHEAYPAFKRWKNLQAATAERKLLTNALLPSKANINSIRGYPNFLQEAHKQKGLLVERLRTAHRAQELLAIADKDTAGTDLGFAAGYLDLWIAVRDWLHRRLPAQVAEVDDPQEALQRLRDQLVSLEERLARQEGDLQGAGEDVARGIEVQIRKARSQIIRLNKNLQGVSFGSIEGIQVQVHPVDRMMQVLQALREGPVQELIFQENMPIEEALDEIFRRYGGVRTGGQRLLDYREYIRLQVEVRRTAGSNWEIANPTRLSTGEAIGVGAALMMVVLTEWERDANLLRNKRSQGSLRFLFLDEANRLSHDNLGVLFDLCQTLDLQLLIAAPEVARADGNTTYRLVRKINSDGREEVLVSGRRTRTEM